MHLSYMVIPIFMFAGDQAEKLPVEIDNPSPIATI